MADHPSPISRPAFPSSAIISERSSPSRVRFAAILVPFFAATDMQWKGGPTDNKFEWISMMVPDGYDWIEYMVRETTPTPQQLGVLHHYALSTMDVQQVYKTVVERGYKPPRSPAIARDGRWLLQLYDKNFTRTEMMIRKPVQTPCCSTNLDDFKQ